MPYTDNCSFQLKGKNEKVWKSFSPPFLFHLHSLTSPFFSIFGWRAYFRAALTKFNSILDTEAIKSPPNHSVEIKTYFYNADSFVVAKKQSLKFLKRPLNTKDKNSNAPKYSVRMMHLDLGFCSESKTKVNNTTMGVKKLI